MRLSDLLVPSTKYSVFNCDVYKKFSANPGILYPVWYNILNPGESASVDLRALIRTWPVESPLMGSLKVRFVTAAFNLKNYAIALEGYKRNFDWRSVKLPIIRFDVNRNALYSDYQSVVDGNWYNAFYVKGVHDTSLADYLGYETGWLPTPSQYPNTYFIDKSFIPFLCYYDFYRNYLVNPQETNFPLFTTRLTKVQNPLKTPYEAMGSTYYVNPYSCVTMVPLAELDNLIDAFHKNYDVDSEDVHLNRSFIEDSAPNFLRHFRWSTTTAVDYTDNNPIGNIMSSAHGGLVSTTFDPDINTQWLSVDNYSKLNEVVVNSQTVGSNTFTSFGDIVKASSLWDFVTKSVNSDGTYGDFIGNQFGVSVKGDMNIPQIVHICDQLLSFDDITSQANTTTGDPDSSSGAVIGQQAGVGRSYGQSNFFRVINKDGNYVVLMTFMWVTPTICYRGGLNWLNNITSFSDLYQPSFDNYAMQPRLQEYVKSALPAKRSSNDRDYYVDSVTQPFDIIQTVAPDSMPADAELGYQPAFTEYKTDIDVVHGLFRHSLDYYTIIREIMPIGAYTGLGANDVFSAYVYSCPSSQSYSLAENAQRYSLPFAIDAEDCLQVQLRVGCKIKRAMSKNINPNIK